MADSTSPAQELPPIPGHRVERVLGRGGFAIVVAATDQSGRRVALKIATAGDSSAAAQLEREKETLRTLSGGPVPALLGYTVLQDRTPFLSLELIEAPTLADRLRETGGPMSADEIGSLGTAVCDAVGWVHRAGIVHLDLKPENIFLTTEGVRLIDFGLARRLGVAADGAAFAGTAEYASPEQCEERKDLDGRADIYAIGVLLFQMVTGNLPFTGTLQRVKEAHISVRPVRPSQLVAVNPAVEAIILQALAKDRGRRYSDAAELKSALSAALQDQRIVPTSDRAEIKSPKTRFQRAQVGLVLFSAASDVGTVRETVQSLGGQLAWARQGRYAAIFGGDAERNPVRRALRAAQSITERKLCVRALVDTATVNIQQRSDGSVRYVAPELGSPERYATENDPLGLLSTATASETLSEIPWEAIPGRAGIFAPRSGFGERLETATVLQLGAGPLVGRDEILRDLLGIAKDAVQGRPATATVVAEAGYGKTHLAAALVDKLRNHLAVAELFEFRASEPVPGTADETLRTIFVRVLELTRGATEESARLRFSSLVGPASAAELWPAAALTLRYLSPESTQVRSLAAAPGVLRALSMRAAGQALRARASQRPLCILLDDAQFADDAALDALEFAALAESNAPLFICALARPSFVTTRKAFGERAARQLRVDLGALPPERAAELCRRLLAPAENIPKAAVDLLVARTHGVPLLLLEVVRGLKRDGLVRKRARGDSWFVATDELERLPDSPLIDWLAEREVSTLPPELASHARLMSVLGTEFWPEDVEGVVSILDAEGMRSDFPLDTQVATRRLAATGLLVITRAGGLRFRHALVREAIQRSLQASLAKRIHAAAARFYRTSSGIADMRRLPLLAAHSAAAELNDEAAGIYLQLAQEARIRHLYLDAERSYSCALQLLRDNDWPRRLAAMHGRGSTRYRIGRYEDAFEDLNSARTMAKQLHDSMTEAEILLDASTALDWTNEFVRSSQLVREAEHIVAAGIPSKPLRARLVLGRGRALFRAGRRSEACESLEEAAALAEQVGDDAYETLIISLVILVLLLPELGRVDTAESTSARAMALARARGDQLHLAAVMNNRRNILIARKEVTSACEEQRAFMQIGRELGIFTTEYIGEFNLSELLYQSSEIAAAIEHVDRAVDLERRHPEVASQGPVAVLLRARIECYSGADSAARDLLTDISNAVRSGERESLQQSLSPSDQVLFDAVELSTRDSSSDEWKTVLARSERESIEQEPIEVADLYGTWALRRGRMEEARRAFEEAARRAERIPNIMDARIQKGLAATRGPLK